MAFEAFGKWTEWSPYGNTRQTIDDANVILVEYAAMGLALTLRQLFYQFVARGLMKNTFRNYKRLGDVVDHARLAGMIDWDHIVDLTRFLRTIGTHVSPEHAMKSAVDEYLTDKWLTQEYHVEVWIEKDALAGVFDQVCTEYQVGLFSCRGYTSQSEMYNASNRLRWYEQKQGKHNVILHFGDHDPSGIHMTEDIQTRLDMFCADVHIERIALNMKQIKELNPPPNPTKLNDPRAEDYIHQFGHESWELDALDPLALKALVEKNVKEYRDEDLWEDAIAYEEEGRSRLRQVEEMMRLY